MDQAPQVQAEPDVPANYAEALRFMVNKPFLGTARYRAQSWRADRKGAHPKLLEFESALIRRFTKLGVPMFAHCVFRKNGEQARLFIQGHTKARPGQSPHNFGCAVDIVHSTRAWELPRPCWDLIGHLGKEVAAQLGTPIIWGGDWKTFFDPAHWELRDWKTRRYDPERLAVAGPSLAASKAVYGIVDPDPEPDPEETPFP